MVSAVLVALGLLASPACVVSLPCTSDHFATFKEATVAGPVNMCVSASEVRFTMPPTSDLTETQRDQVCGEKICKEMIATLDDMEIPRCDLLYNGKNVTLQTSLDKFTSICDAPRSHAPEVKERMAKKRATESSAASTWAEVSVYCTALAVMVAYVASDT